MKFSEFKFNLNSVSNKIERYKSLSGDIDTKDEDFEKMRLEIETHMSLALDAVDFIRHNRRKDLAFSDEVARKLKL